MVLTKVVTPSTKKPRPINITRPSMVPKGLKIITKPHTARTTATRQEIHHRLKPTAFTSNERLMEHRLSTKM